MKKWIIKLTVFLLVFVMALAVAGRLMNKGHDNMTMEMADASLPVMVMEYGDIAYNELHGYSTPMDIASMRDHITVLGENRNLSGHIDTYGRAITGLSLELRSIDGERLIENTEITDFDVKNNRINFRLALKDLIEKDVEYALRLILVLDEEKEVSYYTRVVWSDSLHLDEKLDFVQDFHQKIFNKEAAKELTKYLETNSKLEDNSSFHKVNIHSSFKQVTWGTMNVREEGEPVILLTEIGKQTASVLVRYRVATRTDKEDTYYRVLEHYRVRYTSDRMYLLDYERTMTQMPNPSKMYANDKILLGIADENVPLMESEDGSNVVFVVDNQLYLYNADSNKLTIIFSFRDENHEDVRSMYDAHSIKMLDVTEGGNVTFAVYGYMNRGRHEGEVGIQLYTYHSAVNTIEEEIYIPYDKNYSVLKPQMDKLLYINREQEFYLMLEDVVYGINLAEKTYYPLAQLEQSDTIQVSDTNRILVWQEGDDLYHSRQLHVRNLSNGIQKEINVRSDEAIMPLGFMEEDIIYGVARTEDIFRENSGRIFFPMYKVCICDPNGVLLKTYEQEDLYITDCIIEKNQITLERVKRQSNGNYATALPDQIMNNATEETGKYLIVAPSIDIYERYVQIQTRHTIDSKTIQILNPKEVVFEGGRELQLETDAENTRYYVYGPYGVEEIYTDPAKAVILADSISGVVTRQDGNVVWLKGNRLVRNQIMVMKEAKITEESGSLAVCIDEILKKENVARSTQYLLDQGQTAVDILQENLPDTQVLDLTGCSLDSILFYVNQDYPVLAILEDGSAVVITGFNEFNVVIMNPGKGTLAKMGMNDATEWFKKNGNHFVTYIRR